MDKQSKATKWAAGLGSASAGMIAACTVCCAPLVAPMVAALLAASGIGAYRGHILIALVGAAIGVGFWRLRSRSRRCACEDGHCIRRAS
jgi:hypothetical protein